MIHPFQDGNGRVGRLIAFKECLKNNIVPFIIKDSKKSFYYRGLSKWNSEKGYLIALAINGKAYDSVQFSQHIEKLMITGNSHIQFVIGGSLGLADSVLKLADEYISFSHFTFPHQLMRVILAEQIYRAYRIMNHEPYHK